MVCAEQVHQILVGRREDGSEGQVRKLQEQRNDVLDCLRVDRDAAKNQRQPETKFYQSGESHKTVFSGIQRNGLKQQSINVRVKRVGKKGIQ